MHGEVGLAGHAVLSDEGRLGVVEVQAQRRGEVDGHALGVQNVPVGVNAVVERDGVGRAHAVIQGAGAVRRQILVDDVGEVQRGVRGEVEQRGSQVVPVADGHSGRRGDHAPLDGRGGDVVHREEVADAVLGVVIDVLLGLQRVHQRAAVDLIVGVVLVAEAGVQQHAGLDGLRGPADAQVDGDEAVLIGLLRGQREGLREGDALHAPGGGDAVVVLGHGHAGGALAGVAAAEDVIARVDPLAHAEGDERGVILPVVVQQVLVVVGFLQTVALGGADQEAAVGCGDVHLDVAVVHAPHLRLHGENIRREQGEEHRKAQEEAQKFFQ